jgi:hypothetical protein
MSSLSLINQQLNQTLDDNKIVISGIGAVSKKVNQVNSKMDSVVIYIKK